jgi:hypothetical protein
MENTPLIVDAIVNGIEVTYIFFLRVQERCPGLIILTIPTLKHSSQSSPPHHAVTKPVICNASLWGRLDHFILDNWNLLNRLGYLALNSITFQSSHIRLFQIYRVEDIN